MTPSYDAADPRSSCLVPCLRQLMDACSRGGACVKQDIWSWAMFGGTVSCETDGDWWSIKQNYPSLSYATTTHVYHGAELCYGIDTACATCGAGGPQLTVWKWYAGDCNLVAFAFDSGASMAITCVDDGKTYGSTGGCRPELSDSCATGVCGAPPEMPAQPPGF